MKKLHQTKFFLASFFIITILFCSCGGKDPKKPPIKENNFLSLDNNKGLTSFPLPYIDFTKGKSDVMEWEKKFTSHFSESSLPEKNEVLLIFKNLTESDLNPFRKYLIINGKLSKSIISLHKSLIVDKSNTSPSSKLVNLLANAGFNKQKEKEGHFLFSNDSRKITADLSLGIEDFVEIAFYVTPGEQPVPEFVQWLKFNNEGNLIEIPIPFIDFSKGKDAAKEWEREYKSELYKETDTDLYFRTNDPLGLNTNRFYTFGKKQTLSSATYSIASKLIFNINEQELVFNENFELLLFNSGYKEVDNNGQAYKVYDNGTLMMTFSKSSKNPEQSLVTILPSKQKAKAQFNPNAIDFPLLVADKYLPDYDQTEVDKHEKIIGRVFSVKKSTEGENRVFIADPNSSTLNLHIVKYDLKDGTNSDGSERKAGIIATSYSISGPMLEQQKVKDYINNQGFTFERILDLGKIKAYVYINQDKGFSLHVLNSGDSFTLWQFQKLGLIIPEPEPEKKREEFYLPFFDWNTAVDANNPIIQKEIDRKFTASFKPEESADQSFPRPARIESNAPFDIDYLKDKSGVSGFTYRENKEANNPGKVGQIDLSFGSNWKKKGRTLDDKKLVDFLKKEGFELVKSENNQFPSRTYISNKYDAMLVLVEMFGDTFGIFYPKSNDRATINDRIQRTMQYYYNK